MVHPSASADSSVRSIGSALTGLADRIGQARSLDPIAEAAQRVLDKVIPPGPVEDVASGAFLGHPLHPALVAVPIGSWLSVNVLDLTGGNARAARRILAVGNLSAVAAAYTGGNDFRATTGEARRIGLVHAALNDVALMLNVASSLTRRRGRRARGALLSLTATGVVGVSGWLGGHLAYTLGVGVRAAGSPAHPFEPAVGQREPVA